MKTIRIDLPDGYIPLNIREMSESDDYYIGHGNFYLEVDLIEEDKMCKIKYPHPGFDCPCNTELKA